MKISYFLILAFFSAWITFSCNNKKDDAATEDTTVSPDATMPAQDPSATAAIAGGNGMHFMCPKNCKGSGGDAKGTCPVCGSEYVHNAAYHNQSPTATGTPQQPIILDPNGNPTTGATTPPPATEPPPAKNAKGEWHFACSKSCGGGAGGQGVCPKCGSDLVHNQAYHQQ